jgi:hypothetical protein
VRGRTVVGEQGVQEGTNMLTTPPASRARALQNTLTHTCI